MWRRFLITTFLLAVSANACVAAEPAVDPRVLGFIDLLVQDRDPTLKDYSRFSGECGGEGELGFALRQCHSRGWATQTTSCVDFVHQHCQSASEEPAFVLNWIRARFATAGKQYRIVRIDPVVGGTYQIEVRIAKNNLLLFFDRGSHPPGGLVVDVTRINGRTIQQLLHPPGTKRKGS
jgi:hypothetical protein